MRLCAKVKNPCLGKVKHYSSMPPSASGLPDSRSELSTAAVLLIEEKADGIFLYRLTTEGVFITDTWHQSIGEAKDQAKYEFDNEPSQWKEIPESYTELDVVRIALEE